MNMCEYMKYMNIDQNMNIYKKNNSLRNRRKNILNLKHFLLRIVIVAVTVITYD